jgi:two-component system cell cycle sensor histidine kinase/response regulator CckA
MEPKSFGDREHVVLSDQRSAPPVLRRLSASQRVFLMPAVAAVTLSLLFLLNGIDSRHEEALISRIVDGSVPALEIAKSIGWSLELFQRALQDAVAAADINGLSAADAIGKDMSVQIRNGQGNAALDVAELVDIDRELRNYCSLARATSLAMIERRPGTDLTPSLERMTTGYNDLKKRLGSLSTRTRAEMTGAIEVAKATQRTRARVFGLVSIACLILLVGISIVVGRAQERIASAHRAAEERYRQLFELNPQPMWVFDEDSLRFLEVNKAAVNHYGYSREEFGQMTLRDIRPPEDIPLLLEHVSEGEAERHTPRVWTHRTKDRRLLDVEVTSHPIDFDGRAARLALLTDVTESRKAMELSVKSQGMLEKAQHAAHVGSWELDIARDEAAWSDELFRILGLEPRSHAPSRERFFESIHPEDRAAIEAKVAEAVRTGEPHSLVFRIVRPGGELRALHAEGFVERDAHGKPARFFATCQDVTEHRNLEERLRQSQKMEAVGRLAGGVAHDFNNLLTVIQGYTDLLRESLPSGGRDGNAEAVEQIRVASDRAASLTRQLLAFSRQQVLQPKVLNLNTVVANLAPMLQRMIGEDIAFETSLDPRLPSVLADPGQLEQVIMNLVVNARDAMPQGGKLQIETRGVEASAGESSRHPAPRPGPYVVLTVRDTGVGMTPEVQARIFEPFFTTKEVGKGTGLGLATVHGIILQSGGFVRLESEPGRGTTFRIYLPSIEDRVAPARSSADSAAHRSLVSSRTILLIEDEKQVQKLLASVLAAHGYTVLTASDGLEALEAARTHDGPIHLLLSDVVMPGAGGPRVVSEIQGFRPEAQAIFMSGYADDSIVRHGLTESGAHFLQKPFTPVALLKKVQEVLGGTNGAGTKP